MTKIALAVSTILCLDAFGQRTSRTNHSRIGVEATLFRSCSEVEAIAKLTSPGNVGPLYSVELVPEGRSPVASFLSEGLTEGASRWVADHKETVLPFAMFYSINGAYSFLCRNLQNRIMKSSGPGGDPLEFKSVQGKAVILHFDLSNRRMGHVFLITDVPLDIVDGPSLLEEVARRLDLRYAFLYIRSDPWFFGYSADSTPYIFVDRSTAPRVEEYFKTQTITCMTGEGCHLAKSK